MDAPRNPRLQLWCLCACHTWFLLFYVIPCSIFQIPCSNSELCFHSEERQARKQRCFSGKLACWRAGRWAGDPPGARPACPTEVHGCPPPGVLCGAHCPSRTRHRLPPRAAYQDQGDAVLGGGGCGTGHNHGALAAPLHTLALLLRAHCAPHDPGAPFLHLRCFCPRDTTINRGTKPHQGHPGAADFPGARAPL